MRDVIERAFGVLNARFSILKRMASYSVYTQKNIVIKCITLHNFLWQISIDDEIFSQYEDEELIVENDNANHQLKNTNNSPRTSNAIFMQRLGSTKFVAKAFTCTEHSQTFMNGVMETPNQYLQMCRRPLILDTRGNDKFATSQLNKLIKTAPQELNLITSTFILIDYYHFS
ncbi:hypothetical protein Ddye_027390 [Dipteronia dyeriana]|uniref:DDE Tnp4 domain-containing protein n=1 Tax=Dipteronia dyeriana TaxID=168575 RepID=A0AAD9TPY5_9ROSI|nr:hypothetical protein Ddye_027390 [Dipteronia dyeriana]